MQAEAGDGLLVGGPGISQCKGFAVWRVQHVCFLPFFSLYAAFIDGLPENIHAVCNCKPPLVTGPRVQVHGGFPGAGGLY